MIKPEQVPTYVAQKLQRMLYDGETHEAVLIAAALSAWPGSYEFKGRYGQAIALPLPPQEKPDAE